MADRDRDYVGAGDSRLNEDQAYNENPLPGTPGFESESAFRHRVQSDADIPEIRTNQLAPGPLREIEDEPRIEKQTLKFNQQTRHHSK